MPGRRSRSLLVLKVLVWLAALVPLGLLVWYLATGAFIAADPVEEIQHRTGKTALILLFLTLSITPLRRLTGWHRLIRFRRLLGLFSFFYAVLHAFSYFVFDQRMSLESIMADVVEHPWVLVGFAAFLFLIPMAVTSTNGWIRRLGGRRWTWLHRLIYPIAVLGVLHFVWQVKKDVSEPVIYAGVLAFILALRVVSGRLRKSGPNHSEPQPGSLNPPIRVE